MGLITNFNTVGELIDILSNYPKDYEIAIELLRYDGKRKFLKVPKTYRNVRLILQEDIPTLKEVTQNES